MTSTPRPSDGDVDLSVVIGFKDWGVTRLRLAVESLTTSFGSLRGEVIVSDYGSTECPEVGAMVESLGARHVYTATDGVWSRSRALNAGFAASTGRVLVSTDADMVFSPRAMETIGRRITSDPSQALVLQCRNLPEGMGAEWIEEHGLQWDTFSQVATLRPRWGMGGMMATSRAAFLDVRGFDERMQIYGGEDIDFAQRVRRSGRRVSWVEDPDVSMYHMWHPSSRTRADETAEGRAAIEYNRDILLKDRSYVRNTVEWRHRPADAPPLVSVVISTRNRASLLGESIHSALAQTVSDLEVLVVDDGSDDDTREVVESIPDPRVRYLRSPGRGLACARNFAADHSRARYTVVHDDDDLMMPDRVERHLEALEGGDSGTYGGWVDFDDATGSIVAVNRGKPYSLANLLFAPGVYAHATLMLETQLIRDVRYDERFTSGSDYNLAVRLARLGVRLRHTGHVHLVRRLHGGQVTRVDSATQQSAGRWSTAAVLGLMPTEQQNRLRAAARQEQPVDIGHDDASAGELVAPYLPDALVQRDLLVVLPESAPEELKKQLTDAVDVEDRLHPARAWSTCGTLVGATWEQLAAMNSVGSASVTAFRRSASRRSAEPVGASVSAVVRVLAERRLSTIAPTPAVLVTGHSDRAEAEAGPVLLGHWRAGAQDHYLLALPEGAALASSLEGSGEHVVEHLAARETTLSSGSGTTGTAPAGTPGSVAGPQRAPGKQGPKVAGRQGPKAAGKQAQRRREQGKRAPSGEAGSGGPRAGRPDRPGAQAVPSRQGRERPSRAVTRVRLVALAVLLGVALLAAALGAVLAGPWAALAASAVASALAVPALLALVYARRAWHVADRVEYELRQTQRRLGRTLRDEGRRTRKLVASATKAVKTEAKKGAKATQELGAAHQASSAALEASVAAQAKWTAQVLGGEIARLDGQLDGLRKSADGVADRLSSIPGATAEIVRFHDKRAGQQQLAQVQSLLSLYSFVRLRAGAPNLGGWAASPDVMLMLVNELITLRPATVLECGSGASTVWLGLVARELGLDTRIVALEHDETFAEATRRELERHGLDDVAEVRSAALREVESLPRHVTPWYDAECVRDLEDVGLVFVDGPPGETGPQARFPLVPIVRDQLASECVVFLDDAAREDEREVADRWRDLLPDFRVEVPDAEKGVVVFRRDAS